MNKLTDAFILSNGVKVPCVGYGTYLTPNGEIAKNSVIETPYFFETAIIMSSILFVSLSFTWINSLIEFLTLSYI